MEDVNSFKGVSTLYPFQGSLCIKLDPEELDPKSGAASSFIDERWQLKLSQGVNLCVKLPRLPETSHRTS
jgi:hypothetical protein